MKVLFGEPVEALLSVRAFICRVGIAIGRGVIGVEDGASARVGAVWERMVGGVTTKDNQAARRARRIDGD